MISFIRSLLTGKFSFVCSLSVLPLPLLFTPLYRLPASFFFHTGAKQEGLYVLGVSTRERGWWRQTEDTATRGSHGYCPGQGREAEVELIRMAHPTPRNTSPALAK